MATLLGETLQSKRQLGNLARPSYDKAAPLPIVDRGEQLFRTRCSACHTIGGGDKLGPDLLGVVSLRDRKWLTRWLMQPDKLLAEKDPLAIDLYNKFNQLPMPNLKLNDVDTTALIDYMHKSSQNFSSAHSLSIVPQKVPVTAPESNRNGSD